MSEVPLPLPTNEWLDKYFASLIDKDASVPPPKVILEFREQDATSYRSKSVMTRGNLSVMQGKSKVGKTLFLSMMLPALITQQIRYGKFMPVIDNLKDKPAILHFDTEQGDYHAYQTLIRIISHCDYSEHFGYSVLREYAPAERLKIIEESIKHLHQHTSLIILDGIADLTTSYNDEEKASEIVSMLMRWSKIYDVHICSIIHENISVDNENASGWLGRLLYQKSETVMQIKAVDKYVKVCRSRMQRGTEPFEDIFFMFENGQPVINAKNEILNQTSF